MPSECETETVAVQYFLDAEIDGVNGAQRSGPFGSKTTAENAATAMLSRDNVNKVTLIKEAVL